MLSSYSKIYNLGHKAVADLMAGNVLVEEKVDGSQFSFRTDPETGQLYVRSKGADIYPDDPPKMFAAAVETVKAIAFKLQPGWTYRGEVFQKPKHNALEYSRVPVGNVIIFDIDRGQEDFLTSLEKREEAERLGLETVPVLYAGDGAGVTPEWLKLWLETESVLGGAKVEGVVIKAYGRFGIDKKTLMGKYVSEAFKEVMHGAFKDANPKSGDIIERIVQQIRTDARWEKAVQHLREANELQDAPQDIGILRKAVMDDVLEECGPEMMAVLWKWAWPHIQRGAVRGFPEWYKNKLMIQQFGVKPEDQAAPVADGIPEVIIDNE